MPLAIDRSPYVTAPRLSIATGATLLGQLVDAVEDPALEASPAILESAKDLGKLLAKARAADDAATTAAATSTTAGDVELDQRADRTIKAIHLRLQARVLLDDGEPAQRAAEHLALLYPEGLAFTKASYAAQDAVMQRMLRQLKSDELAESLDEIVGPEYIKAFKSLAKAYSTMVKAMGRVVPTTIDQHEVLVEIQAAVVQHASRILGELRDANPKSVARTRALLAPIDNFRARANGGAARPRAPAVAPSPAADADADAAAEA
jgi:hypothetical protein